MPEVGLTSTSIPEDIKADERLKILAEQGALLEQENNNYKRSLTLLKQLRGLLSN
jgi:hypothetical protein